MKILEYNVKSCNLWIDRQVKQISKRVEERQWGTWKHSALLWKVNDKREALTPSSFQAYNIHINGVFHCTMRYRQLHSLHEQLKKDLGGSTLPPFPPKKLLPLSPTQTEERRATLEKYILQCESWPSVTSQLIFISVILLNHKILLCNCLLLQLYWKSVTVFSASVDNFVVFVWFFV